MSKPLICVTGGSGFLGSHTIISLLRSGYSVRTTIRSLSSSSSVRSTLSAHDPSLDLSRLSFVAADLSSDVGWDAAVAGCTHVQHVASPFIATIPKDENELIIPAREGTLHVLRAAAKAGTVKRVVLTSSFAAVGYGSRKSSAEEPFTEEDWTDDGNPDGNSWGPQVTPYFKSKTLAERAAWDFVRNDPAGKKLELAVVNPTWIMGPVLGSKYSISIILVERMMKGNVPLAPDLQFGVIDVRDCAEALVKAMEVPEAAGQRFIATSPPGMTASQVAEVLRRRLKGKGGEKAPGRQAPSWLIKGMAWFDSDMRMITGSLGKRSWIDNGKAKRVLGWEPRSAEEAVVATGQSLVDLKLL